MKTTKYLFIATLLAIGIQRATAQQPVYLDPNAPIEQRVADALSRMTTHEKIQLIHAQSKFTSAGVPRLGIPQLNMDDGPHGVREELEWNTWNVARQTNDSVVAFPSLTCLAATWNPALAATYGNALSEEFAYRGKDVILGPGVNIARTPLCGRNFEYMGEDPLLAATMVQPYISSAQNNGVACCIKHFALNNQEINRFGVNVNVSERALHEIYLPAFKAAVTKAGVWAVMGSYPLWLNTHMCHNDSLLNGILKRSWHFDGAVISDWGGATSTMQAATGGLDIEMGTYTDGKLKEAQFGYNDYYLARPYEELLTQGKLPISTLNDKAARVLRTIFRTAMNRNKVTGSLCSEAHYDACREIGEEGIVLLKNKDQILPITPGRYKRILIVGDNATRSLTKGGGSSELKTLRDVSPLEGITQMMDAQITYAQGYATGRALYDRTDKVSQQQQQQLAQEAISKAHDADLIIFVGGLNKNTRQDCENSDREDYNLSYGQNQLISQLARIQPNLVVVTFGGNAYATPWINEVKALVHCWYLGSMAGVSMANILSGKTNPSGRLPITFARNLGDYGYAHYGTRAYPGEHNQVNYDEDIYVGYRWFDTKKIAPQFAFGYGLSYTTFKYGKAQVSNQQMAAADSIMISIPVTNTGKRSGKETVQLYIGAVKPSTDRPAKELKQFSKISLDAGQTRTVTFTLTPEMLAYYDTPSHRFVSKAGRYKIYIGASSVDIRSTVTISYQ